MSITTEADWWRSAVIYQVYPKSWADSDGDGFGDMAGIRGGLPYLARLGVDAVWFSPWYPSPQVDGGYDVADFRGIDPMFGTVADVELVPTPTTWASRSSSTSSRTTPPTGMRSSRRRGHRAGVPGLGAVYCVRGAGDGSSPPNDWRSVFGGPAWDPVLDRAGQPSGWWYLHLFDSAQPDLNWGHPDVRADFVETLRFWFDRGIDGFRIDVAAGLVKAAGYPHSGENDGPRLTLAEALALPQWDQPDVHEIWREWRRVADAYSPPKAFVGEVWVGSDLSLAQYIRSDELHTAFNFNFLKCPWDAAEMRTIIDASLGTAGSVGAPTTWVLENHDVPRVTTKYAIEATGTRMPEFNTAPVPDVLADHARGLARARAALVFMLGLPGSAYIYQGQELGLEEVVDLPADRRQDPAFHRTAGLEGYRDGCRVPIPWAIEGPSFGFSPNGSSWLPMPEHWGALSVEAQTGDPGSMLELTRRMLRMRRSEPALGDGDMTWVSAPGDSCLVLRRPAGEHEPHVLVAMNLGEAPALVPAAEVLASSSGALEPTQEGIRLPPDTAAWLR